MLTKQKWRMTWKENEIIFGEEEELWAGPEAPSVKRHTLSDPTGTPTAEDSDILYLRLSQDNINDAFHYISIVILILSLNLLVYYSGWV